MSDTQPAPDLRAADEAPELTLAAALERPSGIVVTVYDVPQDQPFEHVVSAIDAVRRLGPGKVVVDQVGPGSTLSEALWQRGISVQGLRKNPAAMDAIVRQLTLRLANCHGLLARTERALRDGKMTDEGFRKNLLFDIEALSERC
jgi:hypothetical protein